MVDEIRAVKADLTSKTDETLALKRVATEEEHQAVAHKLRIASRDVEAIIANTTEALEQNSSLKRQVQLLNESTLTIVGRCKACDKVREGKGQGQGEGEGEGEGWCDWLLRRGHFTPSSFSQRSPLTSYTYHCHLRTLHGQWTLDNGQ